jgi:hypothetical protein
VYCVPSTVDGTINANLSVLKEKNEFYYDSCVVCSRISISTPFVLVYRMF